MKSGISNFFALLLVIGAVFFMVGMHNIDNAWNMGYVEHATGIQLFDSASLGSPMDKDSLYNAGIMITFFGFLISIASALFLFYQPSQSAWGKRRRDTPSDEHL
jgi:hypothetical protein